METLVLCNLGIYCITVFQSGGLGAFEQKQTLDGLDVELNKHAVVLRTFRDTLEAHGHGIINEARNEAVTMPVVHTIDKLKNESRSSASANEQSVKCYNNVKNNIMVAGDEAYLSMDPCVKNYTQKLQSVVQNVNNVIRSTAKLSNSVNTALTNCSKSTSDENGMRDCLNSTVPGLATEMDSLNAQISTVRAESDTRLRNSLRENKVCLQNVSDGLVAKLTVIENEFSDCTARLDRRAKSS